MKDKDREEADITKRNLAEWQAAQLAAIVQSSDDAIIGNTLDGIITSWNKSAEKIYGYREDEVVGRPISLLVPPGSEDEVRQILDKIKNGEYVEHYETLRRKKDGQDIYMSLTVSPIRDAEGRIVAASTIGRDITERKQAEEQLRNSERKIRTTIETIPAFVFSALPDGQIDFVSQNWLNYLGVTPEEVFGWDWTTLVHPEDSDRVVEKWRDWRESLATEEGSERRFRQANGEYRWFLARKSALRDEKGDIVKWYGVLVDIEDQKRAEARLRQALDEVQKLQEQLAKETIVLREEVDSTSMFEEIVGASPALNAVLARIDKVAPTDSIVLITGETGTGKELVARAIHKRSRRAARAFVSVNCAAIPAPLIASELFGHEKGAFTGAHERRIGRFELAEGGTIFLDEIGELPMETQIALLRVLQEQEFERLGGNQPIRANARVITASNRDLQSAIEAGSFRRDLFYRLNVFPIEIPPLRERKEDIPILVEYFIHRYASKLGKKIRSASRKTLDLLQSYSWPGNIRELQNVIERSIIVCDTENLSVDENWFVRDSGQAQPVGQPLSGRLASQAKEMIEAALAESGGRVSGPSGAAAKLGMRSSTLESKIKSLKINKYLFKKSI
jgi:formate hydrogenlyase transcriptional activator